MLSWAGCKAAGCKDRLTTALPPPPMRPAKPALTRWLCCMAAGDQAARAEQLFDRLCSVCKPDASTFNCLVRVYCRLGKVREATNMLEIMLRSGQQVELTTFDAAIDACWATGIVPLQQLAQQLYQRAQQQGLFPTHVLKQVRTCLAHAVAVDVLVSGLLPTVDELACYCHVRLGMQTGSQRTARNARPKSCLRQYSRASFVAQVCGEGYVLDLQLPGGSPHVVLLSLLLLLVQLRDAATTLLTPADNGSAKVLLRLPASVGHCAGREHSC